MNHLKWWQAWVLLICLVLNALINLWRLAVKWGWL
jgi:hypothetical protein